MEGQEARFLGRERRRADHGDVPVSQDELHAAVGQELDSGRLAALAQLGQARLEVPQMPVDAQRAPRLGVAEDVEVLVARERARLVVEAMHQPVEKLAHADRLAPVPPGASGFRADSCAGGLDFGTKKRLRDAA